MHLRKILSSSDLVSDFGKLVPFHILFWQKFQVHLVSSGENENEIVRSRERRRRGRGNGHRPMCDAHANEAAAEFDLKHAGKSKKKQQSCTWITHFIGNHDIRE